MNVMRAGPGFASSRLPITIPTLRHFVCSSLDYYLQSGNFDPKYATHHTNAEARVHTYLQGLPSPAHPSSNIAWTVLVTCAYDEDPMGGPCVPRMEGDGTRVFKLPLGDGSLPLVTLSDCAALALRIFQDRDRWSGKTINSVSPLRHRPGAGRDPEPSRQRAGPLRARVYDEWVDTLPFAGIAVAETDPKGITFEQNFRMWWPAFQHDLLPPTGDLAELKRSYPGLLSYEDWIRETGWDGSTGQFVMRLHDAGVTGKMQQSNYASWFRRIIPYVQRVQHLFS